MNNDEKYLEAPRFMIALAERLGECPGVTRYNTPDEKESETLAHSLVDMGESFARLLNNQFPKLKRGDLRPEELEDVLFEIGEELRHVLYHIRDPKFFRYLDPGTNDGSAIP
jgi:hypothetical protein